MIPEELGARFWLRYAIREGALAEDAGDSVLVVLPDRLQKRFGLSETVSISTEPEVAREEGALLLIQGHPVLEAAAQEVLEAGDVGWACLPWPSKPPPSTPDLVAAARAQVGVDHGRIDRSGQAMPRYRPLLRVGAQVTYLLDSHFHEREEAWVDAISGLPAPPDLLGKLREVPALQAPPAQPVAEPDLPGAARAAHAILEQRAASRREALARQSQGVRRQELRAADAFYDAILASIGQRRAAAPQRQALFDAQSEATLAERARRLQEINDKFEPRHAIRPVRLHLVWVPVVELPVTIRRGERAFPLTLTWWPAAASFAVTPCPHCGAASPLVAAKDRLGCRSCLVRPVPELPSAPPRMEPLMAAAPPPPVAPTSAGAPASAPATSRRGGESGERREPAESFQDYEQHRRRVVRAGNNLGPAFWQAVLERDSWPRKRAHPNSPLRALYRLYGADGPLLAVGMPLGKVPSRSDVSTSDPAPGLLNCTSGMVWADHDRYRYTLRWHFESGKPAIDELLPYLGACHGPLPPSWMLPDRLYDPPQPRELLDPTGAVCGEWSFLSTACRW